MIKPRHWHTIDGMKVTCQGGEPCPNPYSDRRAAEFLGIDPIADEDDERSDFDLLQKKLDHAISASFFYGGMVGMAISVVLFAILVFGMVGK